MEQTFNDFVSLLSPSARDRISEMARKNGRSVQLEIAAQLDEMHRSKVAPAGESEVAQVHLSDIQASLDRQG